MNVEAGRSYFHLRAQPRPGGKSGGICTSGPPGVRLGLPAPVDDLGRYVPGGGPATGQIVTLDHGA